MFKHLSLLILLTLISCAPTPVGILPPPPQATSIQSLPTPLLPSPTAPSATAPTSATSPDLSRLPVGDGKRASAPTVGWIWPCRVDPNAGGAFVEGPWFNGDGTYNFTTKASVDGSVTWPHRFTTSVQGDQRVFTSNDLPNHPTGTYPIAADDDAYQYDRNPNRIREQTLEFSLPANPTLAAQASCVPGAVGILLSGAVLFNALDAPGRDAVAHETQDGCQGHPQESGVYHYHSLSTCLTDAGNGHSPLVGYVLDGFGLYGRYGENGQPLTSADLDECHGHTHALDWDGQAATLYHYHATWDFPYTVGCMRGTVDMQTMMLISGAGGQGAGEQGSETAQPDLAAAAIKLGITEQQLRDALGPPPPNFAEAATKLGLSEQALREALGGP